ncbi:IPT/TIG domain-containing protein, partial [Actinoplanes siamensis]
MTKTSPARRATAFTAAAVAVAGTVVVAIAQPSAAYSAPGTVRAAVDVSPVVTSISPLMGTRDGGTPVTVLGAGFKKLDPDDLKSVTFGGVPAANVWILSDTKLIATTPPGTGNALVKVTSGSGASRSTSAVFGYRLRLAADFADTAAKATGGTEIPVTVSGGSVGSTSSQFAALKITAKVGGIATTRITWVDDSHLKVGVPATTKAVPATMQLVQDGLTGPESAARVNYLPVVSAVTPGSITVAGGDTIKITGSGFLGVDAGDPSAVTVGGVDATYFQVVSATRIDATVPAGEAGKAVVKVTSAGGGSVEGPKVAYRSALAFADGQYLRASGGAHVLTVTGGTLGANVAEYNLAAVSVRTGAGKLTASYVDPTHLRVTVPALTTENADLTLWQDVVAGPVTTIPVAPVVTSLSAVRDTVAGGATVRVKVAGAGAAGSVNFMFGGNPAVCPASGGGSALAFHCTVP